MFMNDKPKSLPFLWNVLKITYGVVGIVAGADKFFNMVTQWEKYVSPMVIKLLPISLTHFMYLVGVIEIVVGLLILSNKYTKQGAYLMAGWLVIIIVNLLSMRMYYDICVRDAVMAVGAYVLAHMTSLVPGSQGNNK